MMDLQQTIAEKAAIDYIAKRDFEWHEEAIVEEAFVTGWQEAMQYVVTYLALTFDCKVPNADAK